MRIIVVGATGTIGRAVVAELEGDHDVVRVGRSGGDSTVDMESEESVRRFYGEIGGFDALVSAAGRASFGPLAELDREEYLLSLHGKLLGQIELVRLGLEAARDGAVFTLTSGVLAHEPTEGSAAVSTVNAGVEAFVAAAALELPRGMRINVVSPPWIAETLEEMARDPSAGMPAAEVARAYRQSIESGRTGEVLDPRRLVANG